jgi:hypothetical protein
MFLKCLCRDALVLMGLSLTLFRLSYGSLPKDGYRLENMISSFYDSLEQMGKVDILYRIVLHAIDFPKDQILDMVKPLVGDGSVLKLISSFLHLPIIDDDGNRGLHMNYGGIPPAGEITRVLFNIVLKNIFDREFPKRFPGIAFIRFHNQVYISTRKNDEVIFDEKAGYSLLEELSEGELSLSGTIDSIEPGDDPFISFHRKRIFLDYDSKVHVCDPR